ncbi:MAG TPA: methyl-accepting chemotaxis protein [Oligoflexus sp.]|uniref:methyl-accepting chemotaxis protein n=1 Tax=Oligoflexus sp. TaxID=1971216 RepID=UPI002D5A7DC4|nr:methyl-accepting chemotaxis protein [Oligoflexus sp.]HYX39847.1 methyl-accepting chemotaxis protein [Oligoflexus sp.]
MARIKLGFKFRLIGISAGSALVLALSFSFFSLRQLKTLENHVESINRDLDIDRKITVLQVSFGNQTQEWKNILLRGDSPADYEKYNANFEKEVQSILDQTNDLEKLLSPKENELLKTFVDEEKVLVEKYRDARGKFLQNMPFSSREADKAVRGADRKVLDSLKALLESRLLASKQSQATLLADERANAYLVFAILAIISLISGTAIVLYSHSAAAMLRSIADNLISGAQQGQARSSHLTDNTQRGAAAAAEQAAAIQETVASMAEMSSMLAQTNAHTQASLLKAGHVSQLTEAGSETMKQMLASMEQIADANSLLKSIVKLVNDISRKVSVINEIAFNTQVVSFNASIEAARAGVTGKGFSVVASEVSNLARTSGQAAKEIQTLLADSADRVKDIVDQTDVRVEAGLHICSEASRRFAEIKEATSQIVSAFGQISEATKEQSLGIKQSSIALDQMNIATSSTNALSSESARLAAEMSREASSFFGLSRQLHCFLTDEIDDGHVRTSTPSPLQKPHDSEKGIGLDPLHTPPQTQLDDRLLERLAERSEKSRSPDKKDESAA